ncbi:MULTISPECIES: dihydrofolate reductase family protein [unclassified Streptomyces]|uniref:dihydrofolate reductase family protein n=1 Tax=unclassified Streptomyces TaxID=2593676 RepID=UPI0006AF8EED|nr:dihydrofolate reductase family protein [Streptomyces sp. WM6378]KOU35113.1 pyrimidine reductase [Streptomyces sp. WM6378]
MRKITAGLFISLDGVVAEPHTWHFPYYNDEMGAAVMGDIHGCDTFLFGRTTYDAFAEAWPARELAGGEDAGLAKDFGDTRKVVVSSRKLDFTWRNSEQLQGDFVAAIEALKAEDSSKGISVTGSVSVVRQLLAAGLLDELRLLVHPIVLGQGLRLFAEGEGPYPLKLVTSQTFRTGVMHLLYAPAEVAEGAAAE